VPDKVFKAANGWELSDKGRVYVAEMTAVVWSQSPAAIEAKALRNSLPKLKNEGCRAFLTEAIDCTECSLFRAAVVLSWVGAVALLYEEAVTNHLAALNAEATRRDSKWKSAKNTDDLGRMKEATFLEIAGAISMIGKNVKQELRLVSSCVMRVGIQTL
jgi:hypothetical protein